MSIDLIRSFPVEERWCVHAYYTLSPYAPDGSGRIVIAGADLETNIGEVILLSAGGEVIDRFGQSPVTPSFWHTGFWQSWSPDARFIYHQSGSQSEPSVVRREVLTGVEVVVPGDMEGVPPTGEPILWCNHGLLYAAGYGDGVYRPDRAPIPFQARNDHGLFRMSFDPPEKTLLLSTREILYRHPHRDRIRQADDQVRSRLGRNEGLTLMTYCVRWSNDGSRFLFYFGNHSVARNRGEPRLSYVFTADRALSELHLALDLSSGPGVHWSWQPDNERLVGYGPDPDNPGHLCLAEVGYDGSGYRKLSHHHSGGHPSIHSAHEGTILTDEGGRRHGVLSLSRLTGRETGHLVLPKFIGAEEPSGRNPSRVCHHPVFSHDGERILCNTLPGRLATVAELTLS